LLEKKATGQGNRSQANDTLVKSAGTIRRGTDVIIFKIFSPKNGKNIMIMYKFT
jgi:hypothetical protein